MVKGNGVKFQPHSLQLQCSRHHLPGERERRGGYGDMLPITLCENILCWMVFEANKKGTRSK